MNRELPLNNSVILLPLNNSVILQRAWKAKVIFWLTVVLLMSVLVCFHDQRKILTIIRVRNIVICISRLPILTSLTCLLFGSSAGSPGYGSDYEEEARFTPNGPVTSSQPTYNSPENELLKQQLIDHHRDSPRPPFTQPQMVQGTRVMYEHNYRIQHPLFSIVQSFNLYFRSSIYIFTVRLARA